MNFLLKSMTIVLSLIVGLNAMDIDMDREGNYNDCPDEIKSLFLSEVVKGNYVDKYFTDFLESVRPLRSVSQEWKGIINKKFMHETMVLGCKQICPEFLNGKLIYKPNCEDNDGMIELLLSEVWNPLGGTFDLSQCGDTGRHLSISTGYRKGTRAENSDKVEIWIAPRFLIEKELNSTAAHFEIIFPERWKDTAPVGIFWTEGWADGNMDYLTTQSKDDLGSDNLYEKWSARRVMWHSVRMVDLEWCFQHLATRNAEMQLLYQKFFMLVL